MVGSSFALLGVTLNSRFFLLADFFAATTTAVVLMNNTDAECVLFNRDSYCRRAPRCRS